MAPYVDPSAAAGVRAAPVAADVVPDVVPPVDAVTVELEAMLARLGMLASQVPSGSDAARIDRIAVLERIKAAAAATQAVEVVAFARSQAAAQMTAGVHPRKIGKGVGDQVGLACHVSPTEGSRRLRVARTVVLDLPLVNAQWRAGVVSEWTVSSIVTETRHLDPGQRQGLDADLAAGLGRLSHGQAVAKARRLGYEADRRAFVNRGRTERQHRRVSLRPAPDTMSVLTGYLPVEQGVACLAALHAQADRLAGVGDETRNRDQIMADTLVERLTGQASASDVNVEVSLLMPVESLIQPDDTRPAELLGHGPIPTDLARQLLGTGEGQKWWRRLFTAPGHDGGAGPIVGGDPRRRRFDGWLAKLIHLRDLTCRDPYCDAPIRHLDHIARHTDGGLTTLDNGRGVCERGNHTRELPGWRVESVDDGLHGRPHQVRTTTPTGHVYTSQAPQPP